MGCGSSSLNPSNDNRDDLQPRAIPHTPSETQRKEAIPVSNPDSTAINGQSAPQMTKVKHPQNFENDVDGDGTSGTSKTAEQKGMTAKEQRKQQRRKLEAKARARMAGGTDRSADIAGIAWS